MSNLRLVTTERFGEIDCNFYRNMNNDILLTREQIGSALEYKNPVDAIKEIHRKHKDRLNKFSMIEKIQGGVSTTTYPENDGGKQNRALYTTKGVMEIWDRKSVV